MVNLQIKKPKMARAKITSRETMAIFWVGSMKAISCQVPSGFARVRTWEFGIIGVHM